MEQTLTTPRTAFDFVLELLAENQRKIEFCESDESGSIGFSELDKAKAKHVELINAALAVAPSIAAVVEHFEDGPARRKRIDEIASAHAFIGSVTFGLEDTPVITIDPELRELSRLQAADVAFMVCDLVRDLGADHATVVADRAFMFDAALETLDGEDITSVLTAHLA